MSLNGPLALDIALPLRHLSTWDAAREESRQRTGDWFQHSANRRELSVKE